jgi:RNA polymerase sigma-70 factor (ECF subfamily)
VDDTDATVPFPDIPAAVTRNDTVDDQTCDSVASVLQVEWASCYQAEMPRLIRYLMKCFRDSDMRDAADAAQTAFTELFVKWGTVRKPEAWLRKVAFRQMLRQHATADFPLDALSREPAVLAASVRLELREEAQVVLDRLRQLPLAQRQVLALMCDQFSYSEIAEILDMRETAVRKNAERGRAKMKQLLGDT